MREEKVFVQDDESLDLLFGGGLKVIQKKKGYRFSLDALLLAHFASFHHHHADSIIELGTGSGVIPLILSRSFREARMVGVEIQDSLADLAQRNVIMNERSDRITIVKGDLRMLRGLYPASSFDLVLSNPPFYPVRAGRINPHSERAMARHEMAGTLSDLVKTAFHLLKHRGRFVVIYPAFRLIDLTSELRKNGLEPKLMRTVHSRSDSEAKMVLLSSSRGGRSALKVLAPFVVYQEGGIYTEELQGIYEWVGSSLPEVADPLLLTD